MVQMQRSSKPWWMTDLYSEDFALPMSFRDEAGPNGVALVRAYDSGLTDPGWGLTPPKGSSEGFMPRYSRNDFAERRILYGYEKGKWNFAIVMRSLRLICVDIDGKNGGLEHASKLGLLPPTLAETSRSGDGFHLFYLVDDEWHPEKGFGSLGDRIGIEQGVDIRATGCVYHYPQQRWNGRLLARLPKHMYELLRNREQKIEARSAQIRAIMEGDDELSQLMLQDELTSELNKPIPAGKRNQTLFAIGCQLYTAAVPNWQSLIEDRATQLGLDGPEIEKLLRNIETYS